jgi:hypothetical protein
VRPHFLVLLFVIAASCLTPVDVGAHDGGMDAGPLIDAGWTVDAGSCGIQASSTLPGVHLELHATSCVLSLSQDAGLVVPYSVVVDRPLEHFVPAAPYWYGADVANLVLDEEVSGNGQHYCVCDRGLPWRTCPLSDGGFEPRTGSCGEVTVPAGTWERTFSWTGYNWTGPSDTVNPLGAAFPPGTYTLTISTAPGSVADAGPGLSATATLQVVVTP